MSYGTIQVGNVLTFRLTLKDQAGAVVDISGATTKQLLFLKPDGTAVTQTAAFSTSGADGKLQYATTTTDLDLQGNWYVQAKVVTASWTRRWEKVPFEVHGNIA